MTALRLVPCCGSRVEYVHFLRLMHQPTTHLQLGADGDAGQQRFCHGGGPGARNRLRKRDECDLVALQSDFSTLHEAAEPAGHVVCRDVQKACAP